MAVALPARNVTVEDPLPGAPIEAGLKFAVAPAGKPEAESAIAELKIPEIVVVIVDEQHAAAVDQPAYVASLGVAEPHRQVPGEVEQRIP